MNLAALGALLNGDTDNAITASTPGGIEAQEAEGQKQLVASCNLPIEAQFDDDKAALEAAGVIFGDPVDDLFRSVALPEGWKLKATDHSMWSELLDDKGRNRASIFYKAAFYDRSAFYRCNTRFSIETDYSDEYSEDAGYLVSLLAKDAGKTIKVFGSYSSRVDDEKSATLDKESNEWLIEKYPDHKSKSAYWNS